jgi:hypothetical protein
MSLSISAGFFAQAFSVIWIKPSITTQPDAVNRVERIADFFGC